MNNFIVLTQTNNNIHINPQMICSMIPYETFTQIQLMGGHSYQVKENTEEILKLINKTKYTFITHDTQKP